MIEQLERLPELLAAHLQLSLIALLLGILISVPLGILLTRRPPWVPTALGFASLIQTIPSLALLAFMVPFLGALSSVTHTWFGFEVSAIGYGPALIALTLYSMLPILQNTLTGVLSVDEALKEVALGVGMTDRQQLWRVELPLALPVIVAGIRTASVWVVGMTTLATTIGAPSLGNYIFTGLLTRNFTAVTVGCIASAGLALLLDNLIWFGQQAIATRNNIRIRATILSLTVLYGFVAYTFAVDTFHSDKLPVVRIGSKGFTEAYIMSEILAYQIERQSSYRTTQTKSLGSAVVFEALKTGDLDVYVDYSGTIWTNVMNRGSPPRQPETLLSEVQRSLAEEHNIVLIAPLGYENRYAFAMRRQTAETIGVTTLTELVSHAGELEMAADFEFFGRPEWQSVQAKYGLRFRKRRSMDSALMYAAVAQNEVDIISAYSTDGRIDAFDLFVLEDDLRAIPPYHAIILMNGDFARNNPEVVRALEPLRERFNEAMVRQLNRQVDQAKKSPREVGRSAVQTLLEPVR